MQHNSIVYNILDVFVSFSFLSINLARVVSSWIFLLFVSFFFNVDMRVVIIGSGLIGRCWSVIYARAKCDVFLFDTIPSMLAGALSDISSQLEQLNQFNLLFSQTPADVLKRVQTIDTMEKLTELFKQGIDHVQECIPEDVEIKRKVFLQLDEIVPPNALIASSSSCIMPSQFTEEMKTRNRCIIA